MKIVELLTGITVPITNEEAEVFSKFKDGAVIARSSLSDREQLLANQLVLKEILTRKKKGGKVVFAKKVR